MNSSDNIVRLVNPLDILFADYCDFREMELNFLDNPDDENSIDFLLSALECLYKQDFRKLKLEEIFQIYNFTVGSINGYESPGFNQIEFDGQLFLANIEELSAGEALTIMEFSRIYEKRRGEKVYDANIDFNLGLEELSVLFKKPGEYLPFNATKREAFINERKNFFADKIKLYQVLDLRFFFIRKWLKSMTMERMSHFLVGLIDMLRQSHLKSF